ncbi:unnamed protein product [Cuscuta epithymum]|uniref:Protein Iojap, chloroplastic n=1 Tax=Cuscuta epithymum TaxID=186058 RepID=A0AAV0DTV7_9ASTE|nr:unnamed protein product [Cuscuta epithymum]
MEIYAGALGSRTPNPALLTSRDGPHSVHAKPPFISASRRRKQLPSWSSNLFTPRNSARTFTPTSPGYLGMIPRRAAAASDTTDDMFDDLIEKYGELVFRRNDNKTASEDAEDDAQSLLFAVAVANVANDVKAADIKVLFVKPLVYWTRFFIIATAMSRPQIDAIATKIRDLGEKQFGRVASGDLKPNSWTLLDFGDIVVHIFLPEQRQLYNLEKFYGNATPIDLPFENQQFQRSQYLQNSSPHE